MSRVMRNGLLRCRGRASEERFVEILHTIMYMFLFHAW
jgi:hypothetical protein